MSDGWVSIARPGKGRASWIHYDHKVEIRVRPVGTVGFEVALLRVAPIGTDSPPDPLDVYATVERTMRAAAERVKWIKENAERLLRGEETEVARE